MLDRGAIRCTPHAAGMRIAPFPPGPYCPPSSPVAGNEILKEIVMLLSRRARKGHERLAEAVDEE